MAPLSFGIVGVKRREDPHAPYPLGLLRARHEWPRDGRAAKQGNEITPPHSITSSAMASSDGGTSMPSARAV